MPAIDTILAPEAGFGLERLACCDGMSPTPYIFLQIVGMNELRPARIFNLLGGKASKIDPLLVEVANVPVGFGSEDLLRHRFGHESETLSALSQRDLRFFTFGDVADVALNNFVVAFLIEVGNKLHVVALPRFGADRQILATDKPLFVQFSERVLAGFLIFPQTDF